jgi:hypothetical protein
MLENQRREPCHVFRPDGITLSGELLQGCVDIKDVPENQDIHDQAQSSQLILLALAVALAQFSRFVMEDRAGEFVAVFTRI